MIARLMTWARLTVYLVAILAVCLYCEVIGRVWTLWLAPEGSRSRARRANLVARHWHVALTDLTLRLLRCRLDVRGAVPPGRYIVVSNHQSFADIVLLPWVLRSLNVKFVAKEELRRGIPTVSMALTYWGSALITREANRDDIGRMRAMARGLRYWEGSVVIFPEGTRSRECGLLPYKAGAVRIVAKEARLPLLPVAIDGTHVAPDLSALVRFMPGARGAVTIGTPVPPDVWDDRLEEVVEEIRTWASETIVQGRRDGTVPPPAGWIDEQLDSCVLANAIADD